MFQVIQGQSRYELQQQILLNPNGLAINTSNRFGDVDALGNISSIKSVSHPNFGNNLTNNVLTKQPTLSAAKWGTQNAVFFDHTNFQSLEKLNDTFKPEWNVERFIGVKFEVFADPSYTGFFTTIYCRGENILNRNSVMIALGGRSGIYFNKICVQSCAYNTITNSWKVKLIRSVNTFEVGEHSMLYQWGGTNNLIDDKLYVDGVLEPFVIVINNSFVDSTLFPNLAQYLMRYGRNERSDQFWRGYLGKVIDSTGVADITNVFNSLNSAI